MDRNEAIKVIKDNWPEIKPKLSEAIQILIPELKQSEDEKIRKCVKRLTNGLTEEHFARCGASLNEIHAWLERQGEHANFRNKIQIGDEVTRNEDGILVNLSQFERIVKNKVKQGEQDSAWSEEDEAHVKSLCKRLKGLCRREFVTTRFAINEDEEWLKSIKEKMKGE